MNPALPSYAVKIVALALLLILSTCNRKPAVPALKRYPFTGRVIALDPSTQSAIINGDAIPGFMDSMAMSYKVKDAAEFKQLTSGDSVSAEVVVSQPQSSGDDASTDYWLEKVRVTAHAKEPAAKPSSSLHLPTPGEQVPDFAFTNQDGQRISISQYRGKTLLVTFIYTRCPFPDFCPRVSHEFAAVYHQLATSNTKIHLLSLSFDPAHDSPRALREYAFSLAGSKDAALFHRWEFATARPADLPAIANFFAFQYQDDPGGAAITHSLSTTVIGPDGKIVSWRHGSDWHAPDLLKDAGAA